MQAIKDAVAILRAIHGTPAEIGRAWIVADDLEALLKQEPVGELREDGEIKFLCWSSEVPDVGAKLYAAQVSSEPVNARLLDALTGLLEDITGLVAESDGVVGLHLNGDIAPWDELLPSGQFERLSHVELAQEAIAAASEQAKPAKLEGLSSDSMRAFEQGREAGRAEAFEAAEQAKPTPELTDDRPKARPDGEWLCVEIDGNRELSCCNSTDKTAYHFILDSHGVETRIALTEEALAAMVHVVNKLRSMK